MLWLFFFSDRNFVSDRSSIGSLSSANAAGRIQQLHLSEDLSPREIQENTFSLQAGIYIIIFLCIIFGVIIFIALLFSAVLLFEAGLLVLLFVISCKTRKSPIY